MARQNTDLVLVEGETSIVLRPLSLRPIQGVSAYDEAWLRNLIFANVGSIPVGEIAPAFGPLVPICKELVTRAGPADALFVNALGMPTLVECKLWRNPQARREVVGQIIDYARVLRDWTYVDMQREVARARREQGFNLAEYVGLHSGDPDFSEAVFCDNLGRNLRRGHILLLIVGDGIREGVEAIANYIQETAALHFVLGLVEVAVFKLDDARLIVQPRVLAKTSIIERVIVERSHDSISATEPVADAVVDRTAVVGETRNAAPDERQLWMRGFWSELLSTLKLDDADQPMANVLSQSNIFFSLPAKPDMWLTCFFEQRTRRIGVFLGSTMGSVRAIQISNALERDSEDITAEFDAAGVDVDVRRNPNGKLEIVAAKTFVVLRDDAIRAEQLAWFRRTINAFVNVLRPRMSELAAERF